MPPHVSPMHMWDVLTQVRFCQGVHLPFQDVSGYTSWYLLPAKTASLLRSIERQCAETSKLSDLVMGPAGGYYRSLFQIEETMCCAWRDQIVFDAKQAYRVFRQGEEDTSAEATLLRNIYALMNGLSDYCDDAFSPQLVSDLCDRVLSGVDFSSLNLRASYRKPRFPDMSDGEYERFAHEQMQAICAYANGEIGDGCEDEVVKGLVLRTAFCAFCPNLSIAYIVSQLLFGIYAMKHGYPLLSAIPFTQAVLEFEQESQLVTSRDRGFLVENLGSKSQGSIDRQRRRIDYTPLLMVAVDMATSALGRLALFVEERERESECFSTESSETGPLNRRQRDLLGEMARNPDRDYTVDEHRRKHAVSYATARCDMVDLVERGLAVQHKRGKVHLFRVKM